MIKTDHCRPHPITNPLGSLQSVFHMGLHGICMRLGKSWNVVNSDLSRTKSDNVTRVFCMGTHEFCMDEIITDNNRFGKLCFAWDWSEISIRLHGLYVEMHCFHFFINYWHWAPPSKVVCVWFKENSPAALIIVTPKVSKCLWCIEMLSVNERYIHHLDNRNTSNIQQKVPHGKRKPAKMMGGKHAQDSSRDQGFWFSRVWCFSARL